MRSFIKTYLYKIEKWSEDGGQYHITLNPEYYFADGSQYKSPMTSLECCRSLAYAKKKG